MPKKPFPAYKLHKATGQARVIVNGRHTYLGKHNSPESKARYARLLTEQAAALPPASGDQGAIQVAQPTVLELLAAYWTWAESYYVRNGVPTGEQDGIRATIRLVNDTYRELPAAEFGPLALKAIQRRLIGAGKSRKYINHHTARIKRIFKWAASEQIVPVTTFQALTTVSGLHKGKTAAREPAPIRPVAPEVVDATLPFLPSAAADMVRLQRLTGCRPGEIVLLRPRDVDRSNPVWQYRPMSHKTEHHGRERVVLIGPSAQAILAPYLSLHDKDAFCFQTERPNRNKSGGRYTSQSYHQRVHSACDAADAKAHEERRETPANERLVPRWAPNQLRHAAATEIRSRFGLEAASTVLGHSKADVTQIYAERDLQKAAAIMAAVG